ALLACAPVGLRVTVGDASGRLLVALYVVVAGAALALAWRVFWEGGRRELGPLAWPLALLVAWTGVALAWSDDPRRGATLLALAVLPFGLLAVALARLRWRPGWVGLLWAQLALTAVVAAAVGLSQYAGRDVRIGVGDA